MLLLIPLLTALIFAAVYPLCFWIHSRDPLKNDFHKFHIGLPNFVGGVAVVSLFFIPMPTSIRTAAVIWKVIMLSTSKYYWKKGFVDHRMITVPCLSGIIVSNWVCFELVLKPLLMKGLITSNALIPIYFINVLGGLVFCAALFAMNLGHWYLNVHGLPITHLLRSVYVLGIFLFVRLLWDIPMMIWGKVVTQGETIPVLTFIRHLDGFFIWIAFFFGTVFPFISLYFVRGTLVVKSTQSATGILYVVLTSVLIGDLTYKYYLIKYGLAL